MLGNAIQKKIIESIKMQLPEGMNLAIALGDILQLNKNAIYKRINGATYLTLDDLGKLAQHFDLPMKTILYPEDPVFSGFFTGISAKKSVLEFLRITEKELEEACKIPDLHVKSVSIDILDFHPFYFPELALFLVYIWERMAWARPDWQTKKFRLEMSDHQQIVALAQRQANYYSQLKTTEIWNDYVLDDIFHEILYVVDSHLYEKREDIEKVLDATEKLVAHLRGMAYTGLRYPPNGQPSSKAKPFAIYFSELLRSNVFTLLESPFGGMAFSMMDNPNFIKTPDPKIIEHLSAAFERIRNRSVPIGKNGERYRDVYFNKLKERQRFFSEKIRTRLNG